jgi:hypothetical protein
VAVLARRLAAVAKEVEDPEVPKDVETRASIEKYCEKFENDMLKLFDRYYRKGDPKGMAVGRLSSRRFMADGMPALRQDATGLQRRPDLRTALCQPTRLLHQQGAHARRRR